MNSLLSTRYLESFFLHFPILKLFVLQDCFSQTLNLDSDVNRYSRCQILISEISQFIGGIDSLLFRVAIWRKQATLSGVAVADLGTLMQWLLNGPCPNRQGDIHSEVSANSIDFSLKNFSKGIRGLGKLQDFL